MIKTTISCIQKGDFLYSKKNIGNIISRFSRSNELFFKKGILNPKVQGTSLDYICRVNSRMTIVKLVRWQKNQGYKQKAKKQLIKFSWDLLTWQKFLDISGFRDFNDLSFIVAVFKQQKDNDFTMDINYYQSVDEMINEKYVNGVGYEDPN